MKTYISRHLGGVIAKAHNKFSAVILTGPRQMGKLTLLRMLEPNLPYTTLDSLIELEAAEANPDGYFSTKDLPAIIDEIQYAPELFRSIKMLIDEAKLEDNRNTLLYITGSQRLEMLKGASESLAGRAFILEMLGLSGREIELVDFAQPFLPLLSYTKERKHAGKIPAIQDIWERIFRGDMPELWAVPSLDTTMYYDAYVNTYIKRDVRNLSQVGDEAAFVRFMRSVAFQCGGQLNKASLARDLGISEPTVSRWLSILEASRIIYLLKPYAKNVRKRLVKTPKLYFTNTGLACHLCGLADSASLSTGVFAGHLFENYVVCEIVKSHLNATGSYPELYYYRDSSGKEIDLIIPGQDGLYPIEIKSRRVPKAKDVESFVVIDSVLGENRLPGAVINMHKNVVALAGEDLSIPVTFL